MTVSVSLTAIWQSESLNKLQMQVVLFDMWEQDINNSQECHQNIF